MPALLKRVALVGLLLSVASAARLRRGTGDVSPHQHLSFTQVLATSLKSEAFQKKVDSTVPMLCDGAEQPDQCRNTITKALACQSFVEKAKSFPSDMEGIGAFINRCERIEKRVPNFANVIHWIQTPDDLFNQAVSGAEKRTGINLSNLAGAAELDAADGDAPASSSSGLTGPLDQLDADADVNSLPPLTGN